MVQATTPTFVLTVPETVDLTAAVNVYFTLRQSNVLIEKATSDLTISEHEVRVYLTQEETLKLKDGQASIQLNWTYSGGERACSEIAFVRVTENLLKEVVA